MRKRRKALLWTLVGLLIVFAVVLVFQAPPRVKQPVYNGRTLEKWLDVGAHSGKWGVWGPRNDGKGPTPQQLREAEKSVRAIGTNAIPTLLDWISYRASPFRRSSKDVISVLPPGQARDFLLFTVAGYKHEIRSELGDMGFAILNTNALPAREALSKLVRDSKDAGELWRQKYFEDVLFTITNTPGQ